jgi:hypothetical protein
MNAPNLPGFTAEVSLYKSGGSYYAMVAGSAGSSRITPQLRVNDPVFCLAACVCCWGYDHPFCCYKCDVCLGIETAIVSSEGWRVA